MSQVGNAIRMYFLLRSRGMMKISEIAKELEVKERTVRRLRDDLAEAIIYIDSQTGKNGGYYLNNGVALDNLGISEKEYNSLMVAARNLKDAKEATAEDVSTIVDRLSIAFKDSGSVGFNNHMAKVTLSRMNREVERNMLMDIHAAALTCNKIWISYTSLKGLSERVVRPYATLQYKNDMYFIGFCEMRDEIRDFKLCRINEYKVLGDKFVMDKSFDLRKSKEKCFGIHMGDVISVKLEIGGDMAQIVKEKIWVSNQKITEIGNGTILFQAKMQGMPEIKTWVLGMGKACKVIGPKVLKDEIRAELEEMVKAVDS